MLVDARQLEDGSHTASEMCIVGAGPAGLAIAVPQVGLTSETFVQRHVEQLLPERTVVLTREPRNVGVAPWHTSCPVLTPAAPRSAWHRIVRSLEYARGMPPDAGRTRRFLSHHRVEAVMGEYLDFALCYLGLARRIGARFYAHAHGYDLSKLLRDARWRAAASSGPPPT